MKPLAIILAAAALITASATALADNELTYYAATNPRIIQIPERGDVHQSHASVRRVVPHHIDDDVAPARPQRTVRTDLRPQPRLPLKQQVKEPVRKVAKAAPLPEPELTGPRRALLSAPPPPMASPTPRFGAPMPEAPAPLTTFTPPPAPVSAPDQASASAEQAVAASSSSEDEDHLPPPGDPKLAPPEPKP